MSATARKQVSGGGGKETNGFSRVFRNRGPRGILTPSLSAPCSVLRTGSLTHSRPKGWNQSVPENKHTLDSGSESQRVATGKSLPVCPPALHPTNYRTSGPCLLPPRPPRPPGLRADLSEKPSHDLALFSSWRFSLACVTLRVYCLLC